MFADLPISRTAATGIVDSRISISESLRSLDLSVHGHQDLKIHWISGFMSNETRYTNRYKFRYPGILHSDRETVINRTTLIYE